MTEEQHKWLLLTVRDMDVTLPRPDAAVQIAYDGDMCTLTATQEGYLRLGVEMLKAATVTPCEKQEDGSLLVDVDLSGLMAPDSEIGVDTFLLVDAIPADLDPVPSATAVSNSWSERFTSLLMLGFVGFLVFALLWGIGGIAVFLLGLRR